jgi:LysR family transcriptional activator of nhaA
MSWLNYHHLMYFKTIAKEGSISKASEKLLIGQPALSAQLKKLEEYFDQQLFERRNRQLVLTDAGKAALKYAEQIDSLGVELQQVIKERSFNLRPHITIGALDSVPKSLIVKVIEAAQKIQECLVTTIDGTGEELSRQLSSHMLDLVITNHHLVSADEKTHYSRSIGKLPIFIYGSEKYASLEKDFPESLGNQPFILPTTHSKLRHDIEHFFQQHSLPCKVVAETQDTTIQKLLCVDGFGLIGEPEFAVAPLLEEGKIIRLGKLSQVFEEFFLISTKRVVHNPIADELMKSFHFSS